MREKGLWLGIHCHLGQALRKLFLTVIGVDEEIRSGEMTMESNFFLSQLGIEWIHVGLSVNCHCQVHYEHTPLLASISASLRYLNYIY